MGKARPSAPIRAIRPRERVLLAAACLLALAAALPAQDLAIGPSELRIEERGDGGYHLFVKAKSGLGSVLLTESTKDPALELANYAYRAKERNAVNGGEKRLLDGKFLPESSGWFIVDSTPAPDAAFGSAFELFIPYVLQYGYPWTRNGEIFVADGTFVNVRAFALPHADYRGAWADNPYLVRVTQKPFERPPAAPEAERDLSIYLDDTVKAFTDIAERGKGTVRFVEAAEDLPGELARILDGLAGPRVDLVVCIDTTDSMRDDIDAVKASMRGLLAERVGRFERFRLGLVFYKDYYEEYVAKKWDFTSDLAAFQSRVDAVKVAGGRDIPEAVYEALTEAVAGFAWDADDRLVVLVGDAPPHPLPRGAVTKDTVEAAAAEAEVVIDVIILPH
ncbi:MAG: VWA domain-containing protein [Spirochaetia bacterium]|nr:VWA domain-containing protein [Spirochaetia bacterium]